MAELLELPHFIEQYRVAEMEVRGRGIEARLHLERLAPLEFLDQLRADQHLVRATMQLCNLFLKSRSSFTVQIQVDTSALKRRQVVVAENIKRGARCVCREKRRLRSQDSGSRRARCALTSGNRDVNALRLTWHSTL